MSLEPASSHAAAITVAKVTVTDAQIRALATTPLTIVPAKGLGKIILGPASGHGFAVIDGDTTAGVYTNVDDTGGDRWQFAIGATSVFARYNASMNALLTFGAPGRIILGVETMPAAPNPGVETPGDLENQPLTFSIVNAALGDVAGGDAANTLTVRVGYYVVTL